MGQLFGIAFKDNQVGVAVGTTGKILSTSDGGMNWEEVKSPSEDTLLKVHYLGSQLIAIGLRGAVIASTDDGKSWSTNAIPGHYSWLSGIAFMDGTGVVVGTGGKILATTDDGNIWTRLGIGPIDDGGTRTGEE